MAPAFSLSKWYLDCVGEAGEVFVAYSMRLGWGPFRKGFSSTLEWSEEEGTRTRASLRGFASPSNDAGRSLRWSSRPLGVGGEWFREEPALPSNVLLSSAHGSIEWSCELPRARARIARLAGSGPVVEGRGYAERLTMSLRPWDLPIDELRWGRFLGDGETVVWIEWRGTHPLTVVFRNGVRVPVARISDEEIVLEDGAVLALAERRVLREGSLGSTVFSRVPFLRRLLPRRMSEVWECKWRSRGRLTRAGGGASCGWALHEVVRWR